MKGFITWLLSENNSTQEIRLFDTWHFTYLFVIFFGSILAALLLSKRSAAAKEKALRTLAYLVIGFYIADFFLMPLSDSYGRISIDKLPFHICTLTGVFVPFVQFNKRFWWLRSAAVTLAIASSMMWMCYPGSALGGEPPFSYIIFQTFMYHGFLFAWGFLNLALGVTELKIRELWVDLGAVLVILVWSTLGNTLYEGQNWFFVEHSIFAFLPDKVMPPVVVFCVMGMCLVIYGLYYGIRGLFRLHARRKAPKEDEVVEEKTTVEIQ